MSHPKPDYRAKYYFFNVIKVCCIFFVFFFHATKVFDADEWHIKNPDTLETGSFFFLNLGMAVMPVFFLVSGATVWFSLQKRSVSVFVMNLFKRFLIPLLFGVTILAWPQVYLERVNHGLYEGTVWSFFPLYFQGFYGLGGNFAFLGLHLWYLAFLFVFSLVLIPYFYFGLKNFRKPWLSNIISSPFFLLFLVLLTASPAWKLHSNSLIGARIWGGWNFLEHFLFFASGFVLFSNDQFINRISKFRWWLLLSAIALTVVVLFWKFDTFQPKFRSNYFIFQIVIKSLATWLWMCAMVGIGFVHLNRKSRKVDYLSNAVLPFYILNQPVMILIAFYVVHWNIGMFSKFLLISIGSLVVTMAIYEGIKNLEIFRWLLGTPPKESVKKLSRIVRRKRRSDDKISEPLKVS